MTRWLDNTEQRAWRDYLGTWQYLGQVAAEGFAEYGLSDSDYTLLVPLSEAPDGRLRARDLARDVHWDTSRLSKQVTRMQRRGLVERTPCATDARGYDVLLTPDGRRAIEHAAPRHVELIRQHFLDRLSKSDRDALARIAAKVLPQA